MSTSLTARTTPTTPAPRREGRGRYVMMGAVGVMSLVLTVLVASFMFGGVRGEEFSPEMFKRRTFHYYEVPLIGIQVWPIQRRDTTNRLEQFLAGLPYLKLAAKDGKWDVVHVDTGVRSLGESDLLTTYLDAVDENSDPYWLTWSKKHPELARVFWTRVVMLAQKRLYVLIPPVAELAENADDPKQLEQQLDQLLADQFGQLAREQQLLDKHALAVELFNQALQYRPGDTELLRGRAESLQAQGKAAQAEDETAALRQTPAAEQPAPSDGTDLPRP